MKTTRDPALVDAPDLASLIAGLPEEERAVLLLHYLKGKTTAEIAELLGVPERAVASVLAAGRVRLVEALGLPPRA
jgi:RNA polymerase sigma factor (sigma-70 family)